MDTTTDGPDTQGAGIGALASAANPTYAAVAVSVPLGLAAVAILLRNAPLLNVVHVLLGATWVGATLYLAGVLSPTIGGLAPEARGSVARRLTPKSLFALPPVVIGTLATGPVLAVEYGYWDMSSPTMQVAVGLGLIALLLAIAIAWVQIQMFRELVSPPPDPERMGTLAVRNVQIGVTLAVVQVLIVVSMGALRSGLGI